LQYFILYFAIIVVFTWVQRKRLMNHIYITKRDFSWLVSGVSLALFYVTAFNGQLLYGLISEKKMAGIWMLWSSGLIIFVVPIVFGPLWHKLNLKTDNEFLVFRYQGLGAKFLHIFRSVYVGLFVASIVIGINLKHFSRVVEVYFGLETNQAIGLVGLFLCLFALKNVLSLKIRTDVIQILLFFVGLGTIAYFLTQASGGLPEIREYLRNNPEDFELFPSNGDASIWFNLFIFICINWWSAQLWDGSGPEMVYYSKLRSRKMAFWVGLTPAINQMLVFFLILTMTLMVILLAQEQNSNEIIFVEQLFLYMPEGWEGIILVTYFILFITYSETILTWGASLLSIDLYKNYLQKDVSDKRLVGISFGIMLAISILATLLALSSNQLQQMVKIFFSISAGVAPVYILRWVWFRINAWSQISAMLSSAVCTLCYPLIHEWTPLSPFDMYDARILVTTIVTSLCWIVVTLLTPDSSAIVQEKLLPIIRSRSRILKQLLLAITIGIAWTGIYVIIWHLLFL
jgi:SSS family solute:Na+ symporter